ncbi:hypothetical protein LTR56_016091 [Elasticomyces elasticus]|nr:hypothetical protein LTR56_016091 [Elasticomyces elasticus]KAK3653823.1 hypothetical protein LTR22_011038 [Elasticomyces elasticus]KAK4916025.1 hypothetical protein LTR49_015936 [Elasticomyces elasticus]KAK5755407.1 hypothetical protein LTS12_014514 [Elasticomyces elasticus]
MSENATKTPESRDVVAHNASGPAQKTVLPLVAKKSAMKALPGLKRKLDISTPSLSLDTNVAAKPRKKPQKSIGDILDVPEESGKAARGDLAVTSASLAARTTKPPRKKPGTQLKLVDPKLEEYKLIREGALTLPEPVSHNDEASFNAFRAQRVKLRRDRELERDNIAAGLRTQKKKQLAKEEMLLESDKNGNATEQESGEAMGVVGTATTAEIGETEERSSRDDGAVTHEYEEAEMGDVMVKERVLNGTATTKFKVGTKDFTDSRKSRTQVSAKMHPALLGHVHADVGNRPTGGSASQDRLEPSAKVRGAEVHDNIYDFPDRAELVKNIGHRILWYNRINDQFMSHSVSLLFLLQHAMGRYKTKDKLTKTQSKALESQSNAVVFTSKAACPKSKGGRSKKKVEESNCQGITISFIDTRTARTEDSEKANFYYVPDLIRNIGILEWAGWGSMPMKKLRAPWYDHEWLTHGPVELEASSLRQVPIEDLLAHGLQKLYPALFEGDHPAGDIGLYNGSTHLRYKTFRFSVCRAFTLEELDIAAELTRLFDPRATNPDNEQGLAHESLNGLSINLHIFLLFCSLHRRPADDALFAGYIQKYFCASDAEPLVDMGMEAIPNNLPEVMQYMARLREACVALNIPGPKHLGTVCVDDNYSFDGVWAGDVEKILPKERQTGPKIVLVKGKKERLADAAKAKQIASAAANATEQHGGNFEGLEDAATLKQITDGSNIEYEELAASDRAGASSDFVVEELAVA